MANGLPRLGGGDSPGGAVLSDNLGVAKLRPTGPRDEGRADGDPWTGSIGSPTIPDMDIAYLTRSVRFAAAHRYHCPEWSDEENRRVFGACSNPHGHGHNYVLEATVRGRIDPVTGFSVDLAVLDRILDEVVVQPLDHQHLNHAVDAFAPGRKIPTTENLAAYLWPRIERALPDGVTLHRIRIYEDPTLFVDYYGGSPRPAP